MKSPYRNHWPTHCTAFDRVDVTDKQFDMNLIDSDGTACAWERNMIGNYIALICIAIAVVSWQGLLALVYSILILRRILKIY